MPAKTYREPRKGFKPMNSITQNDKKVKRKQRRDWTEYKKYSLTVADLMQDAGFPKRSKRIRECATMIKGAKCPQCGRTEITSANFCRDRMCPTCAWRLSLKRYAEIMAMVGYLNDLEDYNVGFLTLTVRNCQPHLLGETLKRMSQDWNRLNSRRAFSRMCEGWARSVEVTYNPEAGTFHPHYHVIMLIKGDYDLAHYQVTFRDEWQAAARLAYRPITDFREVRSHKETAEIAGDDAAAGFFTADQFRPDSAVLSGALLEISKYCFKPSDFQTIPVRDFREMVLGLKGLRMCAFGGVLKDARKALDMKEDTQLEDGDDIAPIKCKCGAVMEEIALRWSFSAAQYEAISVDTYNWSYDDRMQRYAAWRLARKGATT